MTSICRWVSSGVVILIALCHCVLSVEKKNVNTVMVPSKLKWHFATNHSHLLHKTTDYFKHLLESQVQQSKVFEKKVTVSEKAQEASYLVAELVTQKKKSHVIAESIIMTACKIIVNTTLCEVEKVHLSDNTISRRIYDMSEDIEDNVFVTLKNTNFCHQVDELIDITNKCHVIAFVRFINEGEITENFYAARSYQKQRKVKTFSTPCLFILKEEDYHGNIALESTQMVPLP
jgi:hypothetical protein